MSVFAVATVLLAVTACSAPPHVVVVPGQVVVDGNTTFRTKDQNRIEVTVLRAFESASGTGVATFHDMDLETARRSPLVRVAVGRAWLDLTSHLGAEAHQAVLACHRALDELGQLYLTKRVFDDSEQYLQIAEDAVAHGNEPGSIPTFEKVIRWRIALYLRGYRGLVE